ncbi:lactonase family protein [Sabulilitoribacter multivorans]|uniref:Lactonase family protein n=1 Tax=Flaviramulus multivorans TaxID=1304750 RepID=A0ABS9IHQ1_9FLAO|nr:lactonase family protein [Flaviramulus multivorans]MCF7559913.1 lactonase family protein [Flaviramulus multivorans]
MNCKPQPISLYVGTYTNGDSEGIYQLQFDTKTGILSDLKLVAATENPSFITFSPDKSFIYAVGETENGSISSFKLEDDSTLKLINTQKTFGGAPCHVSVNSEATKAVVSNYLGGNIALYNINNDGSLSESAQIFDHNDSIQKSHAHSAQFYKNDLFVADLGRNSVYLYGKDQDENYVLKANSIIELTENAGPRHFTLTEDGNFIYIINEYASTITAAKKANDSFDLIDHYSTLESSYSGDNSCADIHLSKDEKFLYGSNRGENSIAVFKRNITDGTLEKIQNISVHGDWPRNFTLDPTGKFMLVANKKSNNISVFNVDTNTGKLSFLNDISIPSPVCLLF